MCIAFVEVAVFTSADFAWLLEEEFSQFDAQLVEFIDKDVNCTEFYHGVYFLLFLHTRTLC